MTWQTNCRLFLSYGRRDAAELANRLRGDLEKLGYEVWQDTREIRAGREWEEQIADGLRSTQVVIALLSPHAVRRASDPNSPDNVDSVCLDELTFARFAAPPTPIVPVMAIMCAPPFQVFRLDYVSMTQWMHSEDEYQRGFERLAAGIEAAATGKPPPMRRWHHCLPVLDFAAQLHEKRRDFVGRQWLFDEIDAWRVSSRHERALLVVGDPGIGKSAFVAEMIHRNPGGQVLAYHICRADDPETLRPSTFVMSLAGMIAGRLPAFADLLESHQFQELFDPKTVSSRPAHVFDQGLIAALHQLPAPTDGIRFVLIDALNEALSLGEGQLNIVSMLSTRLDRLPAWLRIVATTRREPDVLNKLSSLRAAAIDAHRQDNLDDIDRIIEARLQVPTLPDHAYAFPKPAAVDLSQTRLSFTQTSNVTSSQKTSQQPAKRQYRFATCVSLWIKWCVKHSLSRERVDSTRLIAGLLVELCGWYVGFVSLIFFLCIIIDHITLENFRLADEFSPVLLEYLPLAKLILTIGVHFGGGVYETLGLIIVGRRLRLRRRLVKEFSAEVGDKPTVLFLRSFENEADLRDFRNVFSSAVELVMIGRPNEIVPELGGKRFYTAEDWRIHVADMMEHADLVVIRVGQTQGLAWEVAECARRCDPSKIVLMLPSHPDASLRAHAKPKSLFEHIWAVSGDMETELAAQLERLNKYSAFKQLIAEFQQMKLPNNWTGSIVAGFDKDLNLRIPTGVSAIPHALRKVMNLTERVSFELSELLDEKRNLLRLDSAHALNQAAFRLFLQRWTLSLCFISMVGLCIWSTAIDFDSAVAGVTQPFKSILLWSVFTPIFLLYFRQTKPWNAFKRVAALQAALKGAVIE